MFYTVISSQLIKTTFQLLVTYALFLLVSTHALADNSAPIVVTIKPLYSLVAHLTEGIETPVLLLNQAQSPHHYNMKPSERRLLAHARMIVWVGPQMESYLSKIIQQQQNSAIVVSVMQANNLRLLNKRKKHSHHDTINNSAINHEDIHTIDPHIWLSTHNAIAISRQISEQLIAQNPKNAEKIKENLQRLQSKITQTQKFIKSTLKSAHQPFITFHDAFQYFEDENKLNYIDSISFDEDTGSSLKHLRKIKSNIDRNKIQCLVYQLPKSAIVDSLTRQTNVKAIALDPLGDQVNNDKEAWFELMQNLAVNFNNCLNP